MMVARQSNISGLLRLLPIAANHYDADVIYSDATLHELVSCLATSPIAEAFSSADLCDVVFDRFFVVRKSYGTRDVWYSLVRVIWSLTRFYDTIR